MSLERRLREHLNDTGAQLPDPGGDLHGVVRRGRRRRALASSAMGLTAVAVVLGAAAGLRSVTATRVAFEPAPSTSATAGTPAPAPTASPSTGPTDTTASPTSDPSSELQRVRVSDLDGAAIAYTFGGRRVALHRDGETHIVWSGQVRDAVTDGAGGIVVQSGQRLVWIPDVEAPQPVTIVEGDPTLVLRGMLPDGRVMYSTFEDAQDPEDGAEHFFAIARAPDAEPELFATEAGYEAWTTGPVPAADGQLLLATCHMMCSLQRWPHEGEPTSMPAPVYHGGGDPEGPTAAIGAMDATAAGDVVALVEAVPVEGVAPATVVLLDGASFREIARIPLPVDSPVTQDTVSVSPDGQRVLVTVHTYEAAADGDGPVLGNPRTFLIEDVLSATPRLREVDDSVILRWLE